VELTATERGVLTGLVEALRRNVGATEVTLYGSAARGALQEGSDVDLFLVLPRVDWETEKKVVDCCFEAELKCGRVFSTTCFTTDELANGPLRSSPFVLNARKDGRAL